MSLLTKDISEVLKNAPSVIPLATHWLLLRDAQGEIQSASPRLIPTVAYNVETTVVADLNEATTAGLYLLDGSRTPLNGPTGSIVGILEVFTRYSSVIVQRIMARYGFFAIRSCWNGEWSDWKILT